MYRLKHEILEEFRQRASQVLEQLTRTKSETLEEVQLPGEQVWRIRVRTDIIGELDKRLQEVSTLPPIFTKVMSYFIFLAGVGHWFNIYELSMEQKLRLLASRLNPRKRFKLMKVRPSFWVALHSPPGTGRTTFITTLVVPTVNYLLMRGLSRVENQVISNIEKTIDLYVRSLERYKLKKSDVIAVESAESLGEVQILARLALALARITDEEDIIAEQGIDKYIQLPEELKLLEREIYKKFIELSNSTTTLLDLFTVQRPGSTQGLIDTVDELTKISEAILKKRYVFLLFTEAGRIWEESRNVEYLKGLYETLTHIYDGKGKTWEYSRRRLFTKRSRSIPEDIISYAVIEAQKPEIFLTEYEIEQGFARRVAWTYSEDIRIIDINLEEAGIIDAYVLDGAREQKSPVNIPQDLITLAEKITEIAYRTRDGYIALDVVSFTDATGWFQLTSLVWRILMEKRFRYPSHIGIYLSSAYYHIFNRLLLARIFSTPGIDIMFTQYPGTDFITCTPVADPDTVFRTVETALADTLDMVESALAILLRVGYRTLVTSRRAEHINLVTNLVDIVRRMEVEDGKAVTLQDLYERLNRYLSVVSSDILLDAITDAVANKKLNMVIVQYLENLGEQVTGNTSRQILRTETEIYIVSSPTRTVKFLLHLFRQHYEPEGKIILDPASWTLKIVGNITPKMAVLVLSDALGAEKIKLGRKQGFDTLGGYSELPIALMKYVKKNWDKILHHKILRDYDLLRTDRYFYEGDDEEDNRREGQVTEVT